MAGAIGIKGLREFNRAFDRAEKELKTEFRSALKRAAEPVREDAEQLALREITNIGDDWSRMRVGLTRNAVYVAPVERGIKTRVPQRTLFFGLIRIRGPLGKRRPNLAPLLMNEAMEPALEQNRTKVVKELELMLDTIGRNWEKD